MTDDPLEGPKLKIERANAHIDELMITVKAFFDSRPYEIFTERDPNEKEDWVKLRMTRQPPGQIAILVGEALFNLRSALDHLICALAIQHRAAKITDVYFPVGRSKEHFEFPETQRKIQRISDDAKAVVHSLLPYKGGNDLLYALHQIQLIDKHRNLVLIGAIPQGGAFKGTMRTLHAGEHVFRVLKNWRFLDKEIRLVGFPHGGEFKYELQLATDIAFRNVEIVDGQSITATLYQFASLAKSIVLLFENKFFK